MIEQLLYQPSSEPRASAFVMMVDEDSYRQYKKDKSAVPVAQVMDSFEVFKYDNPGTSGQLSKPSRRELQDAFGTTNEMGLAEIFLERGELHGQHGKHEKAPREDDGGKVIRERERAY